MSPGSLSLILCLQLIGQSEQQIDCSASANCDTDSTQQSTPTVITCERNSECKCEDGEPFCTTLAASINVPPFEVVDTDQCKAWCTEAKLAGDGDTTNCKYWKFVHEEPFIISCYLMDSLGCSKQASTQCDNTPFSDHDERPHCMSFHLEGAPDCNQDTGTTTTTTTPPPPTCPGPIKKGDSSDPTKFYQGWRCYQPSASGPTFEIKDMYENDSKMPVGGYCELDDSDGRYVSVYSSES